MQNKGYHNEPGGTGMDTRHRIRSWLLLFTVLIVLLAGSFGVHAGLHPCCPGDPELSYFLNPNPSQMFHYLVRYETFFSTLLGKEKGFFIILPEDFYQNLHARYPVLYLLHGYNFHRRGRNWRPPSPEKAKKALCDVKEEEYHWLVHEDIAPVAYAMMDSRNRTYRDLQHSLEKRFDELSRHGGLLPGDYLPREIALSIVTHNLHPEGKPDDPFPSIRKMILILPDGDNGFYTDENEGKRLFPETKDRDGCDAFHSEETLNYSLFPFLWMKPGALGKYESYLLELMGHVDRQPSYRGRTLPIRGIGGMSMGGFGAVKMGLKYPQLFQSVSSQSGLLDLELLTNRWMLKMAMPEFLEVFGRLEPRKLPPGSELDLKHLRSNNPVRLLKQEKMQQRRHRIYFDYGEREGYSWIMEGNKKFEKALNERSRQIPVQPFNGNAGHNYQFWRSRSGNVLRHHSEMMGKVTVP